MCVIVCVSLSLYKSKHVASRGQFCHRLPLSCQVVQRREPRDLRRRGTVVGHGEAAIVLELEPAGGTLEVAGLSLS